VRRCVLRISDNSVDVTRSHGGPVGGMIPFLLQAGEKTCRGERGNTQHRFIA